MPEPEPSQPEPRRATGKALRRTDAQLDELARVTPDDIDEMRDFWVALAPEGYEGLLEATVEPKERR